MSSEDVPLIDVSPLFGPASAERDSVDLRVVQAVTTVGVMTITGGQRTSALTRRRSLAQRRCQPRQPSPAGEKLSERISWEWSASLPACCRALLEGSGFSGDEFTSAFMGGASGMRLLRYPLRPADAGSTSAFVAHEGEQCMIISEPHFDYGCLTLLVQDESPGLQVRLPGDAWVDILPSEGRVVVNCSRLLDYVWSSLPRLLRLFGDRPRG